ncbi:hypothetical protein BJ741DRAFT_423368 [Chytriomyces cf. hyalinus JEL632]|nr:hypothetical protein BJ741DRAFT_423368 [Chytriomyces cf. hyalinus JEL632]
MRARKSSTTQTASSSATQAATLPPSSVTAASAATAPTASLPTSSRAISLQSHFLRYLNGACPEELKDFKEETAHYRRELNGRRPSLVATVPEWPHKAKIRPEIKKGDNPYAPYTPSQLSGAKRAEHQVIDFQIVNRHLKSQQKWHDMRVKSKYIVKYCHHLGVCTKEQDRLYKRSMIKLKWRGVAFKHDKKN